MTQTAINCQFTPRILLVNQFTRTGHQIGHTSSPAPVVLSIGFIDTVGYNVQAVNIINGFFHKAKWSVAAKCQTHFQPHLPTPVNDISKLCTDEMLRRNHQHIGTCRCNLLNKHTVHADGINMTFNRQIGCRTNACDDLMSAHQLHILQIVHICCI